MPDNHELQNQQQVQLIRQQQQQQQQQQQLHQTHLKQQQLQKQKQQQQLQQKQQQLLIQQKQRQQQIQVQQQIKKQQQLQAQLQLQQQQPQHMQHKLLNTSPIKTETTAYQQQNQSLSHSSGGVNNHSLDHIEPSLFQEIRNGNNPIDNTNISQYLGHFPSRSDQKDNLPSYQNGNS